MNNCVKPRIHKKDFKRVSCGGISLADRLYIIFDRLKHNSPRKLKNPENAKIALPGRQGCRGSTRFCNLVRTQIRRLVITEGFRIKLRTKKASPYGLTGALYEILFYALSPEMGTSLLKKRFSLLFPIIAIVFFIFYHTFYLFATHIFYSPSLRNEKNVVKYIPDGQSI